MKVVVIQMESKEKQTLIRKVNSWVEPLVLLLQQ